jgi:ribosomal RNA assembly protein
VSTKGYKIGTHIGINMNYTLELKIPKERIAVLIGKKGEIKQELEEQTESKINVDSKEGDVQLEGEDSIKLFTLQEVIKAIGRGFNPEIAMLLLKQDYSLEITPLTDYVDKKNHMERIKGRIIGASGKARTTLEELTMTYICIYGKTISIIGLAENVTLARRAIESLIQGSPHANVYRWLEKNRKKMKEKQITDW